LTAVLDDVLKRDALHRLGDHVESAVIDKGVGNAPDVGMV
jgi:hypothetical protein